MKLEKMGAFFDARLADYESHMLEQIRGAREFYPFTAQCLPEIPGAKILDLGCGTGLEMDWYFHRNPTAQVTGIDLAEGMLQRFQEKFSDHALHLICGSYFEVPLGEEEFDAAVSVESLHHFTWEEKLGLYARLYRALKPGGYFVLTDYFALSDEEEQQHRAEYLRLKAQQGLGDESFYHYDTPLTVEREILALEEAGFDTVTVPACWGATHILKAGKKE